MKPGSIFFAALSFFLITFVLLTLPGSAFPEEPFLTKIHFDKWVHIGMFSVLVFIWNFWVIKKNRQRDNVIPILIIVSIASVVYGVLMEYVQKWFIINRSFDVTDILADASGSLIGLLLSIYCLKKIDPCGNRGRNQN